MRETRLGLGALFTPGTAVSTRPRRVRDRRLPHHNGTSLPARHHHPTRAADLTRHHQGFPVSRPLPSLPLACNPRPVRESLGFPASFTPSRYRPRMSRWGQVTDTTRGHVADIAPTSNQTKPTHHMRLHVAPRSIIMSRTRTRPTAIGKSGCHPATTRTANASEQHPSEETRLHTPVRHCIRNSPRPSDETMPYCPNHFKLSRNCPWTDARMQVSKPSSEP